MNPLIALSRIYREPSSVKHVTVSKSEAVRRLIDHDRLKRLEWLLSAKSEIQTVISEYYCDFTNSKTSWNIFEFLCVWCNTWPVLSLSVSVPRSPDWRERVGWRETAQTLGHQEGREQVKNSSIIFMFSDSSAKFYFISILLFFTSVLQTRYYFFFSLLLCLTLLFSLYYALVFTFNSLNT